MTFKKRLAVLEKNPYRHNYIPIIINHILVEPSEDGLKEVEAFAELATNGVIQRLEREADETKRQFENRIQSQPQF